MNRFLLRCVSEIRNDLMILGWKVGQVPCMGQYLFAKPEVISKLRLYLQGFVLEKEKAPASIGKKSALYFVIS